jgi:hypothetical protein
MVKRCPHCQTRPLKTDAESCWYCRKDYRLQPRVRRPVRIRHVRITRRETVRDNPVIGPS